MDPFYLWWVAEVGRPPILGESEAFRLSRAAWAARGRLLVAQGGSRKLTRPRRPERRTEAVGVDG